MSSTQEHGTKQKSSFEKTFHPANFVAGVDNSYTLKQIRDLLACATDFVEKAKYATAFADGTDILGTFGKRLSEVVEELNKYLSKANDRVAELASGAQIGAAVKTLMRCRGDVRPDAHGLEAARAIDKLCGGLPRFCDKTPFLKDWSMIFAEISKNSWFTKMQKVDDNESPYTDGGRQLRHISDFLDGKRNE